MPNHIRPEPSERPKSAGVLALLEKRQLTGSEWSFIFLAKSAGPQVSICVQLDSGMAIDA